MEIRQKSVVSVKPLTACGSKTNPTVPILAFSGCNVAVPPLAELIWATVTPLFAVPAPPAAPGAPLQRVARPTSPWVLAHGSFDDSKLPAANPWYNSRMFGARKAVEYVARNVTSRIGLYRAPNLYV